MLTSERRWALVLGACVPLSLVPDLFLGNPSMSRLVWCVALGAAVAGSPWYPWDRLNRLPLGRILAGMVAVAVVVFGVFSVRKYAVYGDLLARDAAYYDQIFRHVLDGRGWTGSILAHHYHDPPLEGHWAIHFTPVAYLLLPFYALVPRLETLLVLRNAFVLLAAWPMFSLARRHLQPMAALQVTLAMLATPTLLYQPLNSFYFYGMALAPCLWVWWCHEQERPVWMLLPCAAMLMVREDMGIGVSALAGTASLDLLWKRWRARKEPEPGPWLPPWPYWVAFVTGGVWWVGISKFLMPRYGMASGAAIEDWYRGWGGTPGGVVRKFISDHEFIGRVFFNKTKLVYLLGLLRAGGVLAFLGLPVLVAAPYLVINLMVTRPEAATANINYHYSILIVAGIFMALPRVLAWLSGQGAEAVWRQRVLATFVLALSLSQITMVYSRAEVATLRGGPHVEALDGLVERIPDDAGSVAAPSCTLHRLTHHEMLLASDRPMGYTTTRMNWVILAETKGTYLQADWDDAQWTAYLDSFRKSPQYELVHQEAGYGLYRRVAPQE